MMLLFFGICLIFGPFVILAGQRVQKDEHMAMRFAMLQSKASGGLSSAAVEELLKKSKQAKSLVNPRLERISRAFRLDALLLQADSRKGVAQLLAICAFADLVTTGAGWYFTSAWSVAMIAGALASYLPVLWLKMKRKRRVHAMESALPQVVDMIARALRAGHALPAAISIVAEQAPEPARAEFGEIFRKQKFGLPLRDALLDALNHTPSQDFRVLVTAILVQKDTGGNLTQILDRTSAVIRERLKLQRDVRVHTAQGRLTGWILCVLPFVLLIAINLINPGYSDVFLSDPIGRECLCAGVVLLAVGAYMMHRIVSRIEI